ncbi:MAG: hypothetical protein ACI4RA_10145 [Kiritimatiellia bacterium]
MTKSWMVLACALACAGRVVAVSITADTTVTDADVANYVAADIDIADGATLCFHNLSAALTFRGRLTGAGAFVVRSDAMNTAARITFDGDATAFTGGIFVTNHQITATGPRALGSSKFTLDMPEKGSLSYLNGPGDYTCPLDVNVCDTHPLGLVLAEGVTASGEVTWRSGRLCGPGWVTGQMTINGNGHCYGQADVHFKGGVRSTQLGDGSLYSDSGVFYIDSPVARIRSISVTGGTNHFGCANALDPEQNIGIGAGYNSKGLYELHGFDQQCGTISVSNTRPEGEALTGFTSDAPATLTINDQRGEFNFYGNLFGAVSLDYASSVNRRLVLCGTKNSTTGRITVRSGVVAAETNAVFTSLAGIDVCGTGVFELRGHQSAAGAVEIQPSFNAEGLAVTFAESGKLRIPAGMTFEVNAAQVEGAPLAAGAYTQTSPGLADHIDGDGTLVVLGIEKKAEGATFTWKGGAEDDALAVAANWEGGVAPAFDGTERLVFGPEGTARAVVSGMVEAFAIEIAGNAPFELAAADAAAKIVLHQGGFTLTNRVDDALVTHTVGCPVELGYVPQRWVVAANTQFDNQAPLSGPSRVRPPALTIDCPGRVLFQADNSGLYPRLVLTNCTTATSQPYVCHERGLGATTRETEIVGCLPRFMTSRGAMTNKVPLRIRNNVTNAGHGYLNDSGANPLYMDGCVTYDAINAETYLNGNVHFRGGLFHADDKNITLRVPGTGNWIEGDWGFSTKGTVAFDYGTTVNLAATNNVWGLLNIYKNTVKLHGTNTLAVGCPVRLGNAADAYRSNSAVLDLNGFDQSVSELSVGFYTSQMVDFHATVTSAEPAMLEIAQETSSRALTTIQFTGAAGLRFDAPGAIAFTNFTSATTGTLEVRRGTVEFGAGAGWVNVTNVVIGAEGTLAVGEGAGARAFGPERGRSAADVSLAPGGVFRIAAGETATVHSVTRVVDGKSLYCAPGSYGAAGTPGVTRPVDWVQGGGVLQVNASLAKGTLLVVR